MSRRCFIWSSIELVTVNTYIAFIVDGNILVAYAYKGNILVALKRFTRADTVKATQVLLLGLFNFSPSFRKTPSQTFVVSAEISWRLSGIHNVEQHCCHALPKSRHSGKRPAKHPSSQQRLVGVYPESIKPNGFYRLSSACCSASASGVVGRLIN